MKKSSFSEAQIVAIRKEADAGVPVSKIWRKHGINSVTCYKGKTPAGEGKSSLYSRTNMTKVIDLHLAQARINGTQDTQAKSTL